MGYRCIGPACPAQFLLYNPSLTARALQYVFRNDKPEKKLRMAQLKKDN